jgi:S1-C subfamily serine protease
MHTRDFASTLAMLAVAWIGWGALGAHAETTYTYNNHRYTSPAEALADYQRDLDNQITAVTVSPTPVAGKALIVLPDRARMRPLVTNTLGTAMTAEATAYLVAWRHRYLWAVANAIVRARLFQTIQIVERNDTVEPAMDGYSYVIWFQVKSVRPDFTGPWIGQWLMRKSGGALPYHPVSDPGIPVQRQLAAFVDVVRQAVPKLDAGGGPQTAAAAGGASGSLRRASTGTGVIVGSDGLVITNNHVVQDCGEIRIHDRDGSTPVATVKAHDAQNDLALLKASRQWSDVALFRDGAGIRAGDGVVAVGYPLSGLLGSESEANVTTGAVSALQGLSSDTRYLQLTAPVQPGNSGGPLLDMSGHLVGMVTAKLNAIAVAGLTGDIPQNVNFALKAAVVRGFLDANSVTYANAATTNALSAADVGDIAKKFTVLIECRK